MRQITPEKKKSTVPNFPFGERFVLQIKSDRFAFAAVFVFGGSTKLPFMDEVFFLIWRKIRFATMANERPKKHNKQRIRRNNVLLWSWFGLLLSISQWAQTQTRWDDEGCLRVVRKETEPGTYARAMTSASEM